MNLTVTPDEREQFEATGSVVLFREGALVGQWALGVERVEP